MTIRAVNPVFPAGLHPVAKTAVTGITIGMRKTMKTTEVRSTFFEILVFIKGNNSRSGPYEQFMGYGTCRTISQTNTTTYWIRFRFFAAKS